MCDLAGNLQVDSANKRGSLLEVVQVLTDLNLIIRRAYISSDGGWFMDGELSSPFSFFSFPVPMKSFETLMNIPLIDGGMQFSMLQMNMEIRSMRGTYLSVFSRYILSLNLELLVITCRLSFGNFYFYA